MHDVKSRIVDVAVSSNQFKILYRNQALAAVSAGVFAGRGAESQPWIFPRPGFAALARYVLKSDDEVVVYSN